MSTSLAANRYALQISNRSVWVLRTLCAVAFVVTGYLAYTGLRAEQVAGCGGTVFDCEHVLTSRWSKIYGLPVSVPAFALYGAMLACLFALQRDTSDVVRRVSSQFIFVGGLAAGLSAIWFLSLQVFALGHLCLYCVLAHGCALGICATVLSMRPFSGRRTAMLSAISTGSVGLLIALQAFSPEPQTYIIEDYSAQKVAPPAEEEGEAEFLAPVEEEEEEIFEPFGVLNEPPAFSPTRQNEVRFVRASIVPSTLINAIFAVIAGTESEEASTNDPAERSATPAESKEPAETKDPAETKESEATSEPPAAPPERRVVSISGGKTRLDVRQWPLLGNPEAKYVFVEMFDYTCSHCRATHQAISGAQKRFGKDLAIVALPVPLNTACNPATRSNNKDACELARLAVAVWRVNPQAFATFHDWLFESTRNAAEAQRYAGQLVGEAALNAELAQPYAGKYISKHVELYQRAGGGAVPKLLFTKSTVVGEVRSTDSLCSMIERDAVP